MINPWSKKNSGADLEFDFGFEDKISKSKNNSLLKAKQAKNDEFYTQLSDIENELSHYPVDCFKDKVVYCPCDVGIDGLNIPKSNFIKYFENNKDKLGYKKLIHTSIQEGYDFRSDYCTQLLKESDIVVTNPPFSLFREFFKWLMDNKKDFIIVGNQNAIICKGIFPYLREGKVRLGSQTGVKAMFFEIPDGEPVPDEAKRYVERNYGKDNIKGRNMTYLSTTCWYTTVDLQKHNDPLLLTEKYSPEKYPKYDNYDAIDVSKVKEIPCDYYGVMGVPITYMYKHNPDQFDIVALRKNPDGTVEPWTVEREREFNDTILCYGNSRTDEQSKGYYDKWKEHLRTNPNTKETPVDICYPAYSDGYAKPTMRLKKIYARILIQRRRQ